MSSPKISTKDSCRTGRDALAHCHLIRVQMFNDDISAILLFQVFPSWYSFTPSPSLSPTPHLKICECICLNIWGLFSALFAYIVPRLFSGISHPIQRETLHKNRPIGNRPSRPTRVFAKVRAMNRYSFKLCKRHPQLGLLFSYYFKKDRYVPGSGFSRGKIVFSISSPPSHTYSI